MVFAQLRGVARPAPCADGAKQRVCARGEPSRQGPGSEKQKTSRLFSLGVDKVAVAVQANKFRNVPMRPGGNELGPPSQHRRRQADGRNRMTEIVLAIPERALAVLPRLAPMDRRQRD